MKKDTAIPPRYRRILKKGDFNTPPVFSFFQTEYSGLDFLFSKPPHSVSGLRRQESILFKVYKKL